MEDLDGQAADLLVGRWITDRARRVRGDGDVGGGGVALDGKVVRNSGGGGYAGVRLFSAMVHGQAVVIAQTLVPDGTNETTCVPALLDPVPIVGAVVTADAAHCQDATAEYLTGRDAEYVLTVKSNRKALLKQAAAEAVARFVRDHWGIETNLHWVRVVFGEDAHHAYLGAAAQVMAMFCNLAIAFIRLSGTSRITQTLQSIAAGRTRILPLLAASRP